METGIIATMIVFAIVCITTGVLFILAQQNLLKAIQPMNRDMSPGEVWLQLIPLFGIYWQFVVVNRISSSIVNEYNSRANDTSILPEIVMNTNEKPVYSIGIAYCVLLLLSMIPMIGVLFSIAGMVCWIIYWAQLVQYRNKIRTGE